MGTVTRSQLERGDCSAGVNFRQPLVGTYKLYLVNNSLRHRKSAYEDEMSFVTQRISAWLGTTSPSLPLIKRRRERERRQVTQCARPQCARDWRSEPATLRASTGLRGVSVRTDARARSAQRPPESAWGVPAPRAAPGPAGPSLSPAQPGREAAAGPAGRRCGPGAAERADHVLAESFTPRRPRISHRRLVKKREGP